MFIYYFMLYWLLFIYQFGVFVLIASYDKESKKTISSRNVLFKELSQSVQVTKNPHHQEQNACRTINFRQNSNTAIEMVWTPPQNGGQSLAKDLPVDTAQQEKKRKTATIKEEPSDRLHEKQKHRRRYGRRQTSLAFGNGQTVHGCIAPIYIYIIYYKTKSSAASVCLSAINSKTTERIFTRFSPIDRAILPENTAIQFVKVLCELVGI